MGWIPFVGVGHIMDGGELCEWIKLSESDGRMKKEHRMGKYFK